MLKLTTGKRDRSSVPEHLNTSATLAGMDIENHRGGVPLIGPRDLIHSHNFSKSHGRPMTLRCMDDHKANSILVLVANLEALWLRLASPLQSVANERHSCQLIRCRICKGSLTGGTEDELSYLSMIENSHQAELVNFRGAKVQKPQGLRITVARSEP